MAMLFGGANINQGTLGTGSTGKFGIGGGGFGGSGGGFGTGSSGGFGGGNVNQGPLSNLFNQYGQQTAGAQAAALQPYKSNVQASPEESKAYSDAKAYADSIANKSNASFINAMQRGRDATAMALSDVRAGAGARGAGMGSGLSNVLQTRAALAGNRQNQALNAQLTDVALEREGSARSGETTAAGQVAAGRRAQEAQGADMYKYTQDYELRRAQQQQDNMNRSVELALRYMNPFTG